MRSPVPLFSLHRPDPLHWFGLLALPVLFAALAVAWIIFSENLLRIAAPDPGVLPMLRTLNNLLFVLVTSLFWTFWLIRQTRAHRRREMLWRTLFEQAPAPLVLARKGKIVVCNPAFSTLLGQIDPQAILDYPLLSRVSDEEQSALLHQLKGADPRHPHTLHMEIQVLDADNNTVPLVFQLRRILLGRSVYELVCCHPREMSENQASLRGELGMQLLESLPRPLWLWTAQGLCLWSNRAAHEENEAGLARLKRRYGVFQEGRLIGPQAQAELLRPALEAEGAICIPLPSPKEAGESATNLWVLSLRDSADQIQAVAALWENITRMDSSISAMHLLRSLNRVQQSLRSQPTPEMGARVVLETIQSHLAPAGWVAWLQADLHAREASFWSLSGTGELTRTQSHLPMDLAIECGAGGWSDLASLTSLEALPPFLAQIEKAGIDRFERVLPSALVQGHRQMLMLSCRLSPEAELMRLWAQLILDTCAQWPLSGQTSSTVAALPGIDQSPETTETTPAHHG